MTATLPAGWKPISSAPKDGTEILAWRSDCGQFIASYTSADSFPMTQDELDAYDEATLFAKDWFTQWPDATRLDGSEAPTLWQPLPAEPCQTCNDQGAVGNVLTAEPCPDCTPPAATQDDTVARTGNTADHQAGWYAGIDHGRAEARAGAPAAGDALDAARYRLAVADCILILRGDAALGRAEWDRKLDDLAKAKGAA